MGKTKSTRGALAKKKDPQQVAVAWRDPFDQRELHVELFEIDALATKIDSRTICRVIAKAQGVDSDKLNMYFCQGSEPLKPKQKTTWRSPTSRGMLRMPL